MLNISSFGFHFETNGHQPFTPDLKIDGYKVSDLDAKTETRMSKFSGLQKCVVFYIKGTDQCLNTYFPYGKDTTLGEVTSENICNEVSIREIENQNGKRYRAVSRAEADAWEEAHKK